VNYWRGTGKAEAAKPPGAGISPKPCPRKMNGRRKEEQSNSTVHKSVSVTRHLLQVAADPRRVC